MVADPGLEQRVGMDMIEGRDTLWVILLWGTDAAEIFAWVVVVRVVMMGVE